MSKPARPFGANIRAARLGFHWCERHGAFIRMKAETVGGKERNYVELAPAESVPTKSAVKCSYYRRWWDDSAILYYLPWLQPVRRIKRYIAVEVGDDGEIVCELTRAV